MFFKEDLQNNFLGRDKGKIVLLRRKRKKAEKLTKALVETDTRLALLKAELAAKMIKLASQSEDLAPLKQAEEALSAARNHYAFENTPVEIGMVQIALGDMFVKLGKAQADKAAIAKGREAYRAAITLASLHGDDALREELRGKVKHTESLLGHRRETQPLFKVA